MKKLVLIATLLFLALPVVQAQIHPNCGDGGCNPGVEPPDPPATVGGILAGRANPSNQTGS